MVLDKPLLQTPHQHLSVYPVNDVANIKTVPFFFNIQLSYKLV